MAKRFSKLSTKLSTIITILALNSVEALADTPDSYSKLLTEWRALALFIASSKQPDGTIKKDEHAEIIRHYNQLRSETLTQIEQIGRTQIEHIPVAAHFASLKWTKATLGDGWHYRDNGREEFSAWTKNIYWEFERPQGDDLSVSAPLTVNLGIGARAHQAKVARLQGAYKDIERFAALEREFWRTLSNFDFVAPFNLDAPIEKDLWPLYLEGALQGRLSPKLFQTGQLRTASRDRLGQALKLALNQLSQDERPVEYALVKDLHDRLPQLAPPDVNQRILEIKKSGQLSEFEFPDILNIDEWNDPARASKTELFFSNLKPTDYDSTLVLMKWAFDALEKDRETKGGPRQTFKEFEQGIIHMVGADPNLQYDFHVEITDRLEPVSAKRFPGVAHAKLTLKGASASEHPIEFDYCHHCEAEVRSQSNQQVNSRRTQLVHDGSYAAPLCVLMTKALNAPRATEVVAVGAK